MRRIDDFLVDRVFQLVADKVAWLASCYKLARIFYVSSDVFVAIYAFMQPNILRAITFTSIAYIVYTGSARAQSMDERAAQNVLPIERIVFLPLRIFVLALICFNLIWDTSFTLGWDYFINDLSFALLLIGAYFAACRKNPPKPKEAKLAIGQFAFGGQ